MTTLAEQLEMIAWSPGFDSDHKATLLKATATLERANIDKFDPDIRNMLMLLQDAQVSIGKACEWLRNYILNDVKDPLPVWDDVDDT